MSGLGFETSCLRHGSLLQSEVAAPRKAQEFRIRIEGFVGDGKHDKCSEHRLGPDETFRSGMIFLILRSNGAIFV
jgi:hypothetical protein